MSIESIRARMEEHDRQRERFGYCDETAPQIWERELRALLKVAEAARKADAALTRRGELWRDGLTIDEINALSDMDAALDELETMK